MVSPNISHTATVNAKFIGWNLLGYSDAADVIVSDAFGDKAQVTTVWKWTGAGWAFYSPELPDGGLAYAASKGYDFLTTIKSGDGFWVNAKTAFSTTLPAVPKPVNQDALTGITATLKAISDQFATSIPTSTAVLATLVDDTFLTGRDNKSTFLQSLLLPGKGPSIGTTFGDFALLNPVDPGAAQNDSNHQWFTASVSNGSDLTAWLAIKNATGNWLIAGDQRLIDFFAATQVIKQIALNGAVSYNNQINASVNVNKNGQSGNVSKVVLTGPGVLPASGATVYSAGVGPIYMQSCGGYYNNTYYNNTTNCIDAGAATAGSQYAVKVYTTDVGSSVPAYTYINALRSAPVSASNWSSLPFPTITDVIGNWAPGTSISVNWTLPATTNVEWLSANAESSSGGQVFNSVGTNLSRSSTSVTLNLPYYSGVMSSKSIGLSAIDASGTRLFVDQQW
jgi:hypothetical protein